MSVGKTCDDGTIAIFTQSGVTVHKDTDVLITCQGEPLLIGARDAQGRYRIPLTQHKGRWQPRRPSKKARQTLRHANSVYDLPSTEQAIRWMHAVCGYPVKSTWLKAVQAGNFIGWPLLTSRNVQKYFPETVETPKGTSTNAARTPGLPNRNRFPSKPSSLPNSSAANYATCKHTSMIHAAPSSQTKQDNSLTALPQATITSWLHRAGVVPRKHVLDNEISTAMKTLITDTYKMTYELVPPGCHRRNAAEVAIRNFKSHFLSILAGVADDFPMKLWDKLLPQAEITINLLRQSNATPTVSAYAHLNGPFDYNKMPLAPMGCSVQVHEKSDARGTWAFHSIDGWYLSTSPEHYRTHRCHIKSTNSRFGMCCCTQRHHSPTKDITDLKALLDITASTSNTSDCVPRLPSRASPHSQNQTPQTPGHATVPDSAPACNTRSHTAAKAKLLAAPATNTRATRVSRIPKPIPILSKRMKRVDKEVHRALAVMDQDTGTLLNYALLRHPAYHDSWTKSSANEFGRLANGVGGRIKGTNTIRFIRKRDIPKNRLKDITYGQFVCTIRPEKKEPNRTRLVVGGDRINYPGEVATPTADMLAAKILFNSVISTAKARFMTMDISNFYLNTPLKRPEYIRMKLSDIPEEIITEYKLRDLVEPDDCVYIIIVLGMYGLPHAGLIANELLEKP
eukprot:CCRYP_005110-RA/>CCRYP_005110-RA protein AED:0.26 eAED:0.28 QI:0/0/0/1/1/1/4/0/679